MDKRKDINKGSGDNNSDGKVTSGVRSKVGCSTLLKKFVPVTKIRKAMAFHCFSNPREGGDGRGGDRNKKGDGGGSGSSGGDGHGGGSGSGSGSIGGDGHGDEKKGPKDPQDDRNKHRYHSGYENWYSVGLSLVLKAINQEKPNV